MFDDLSGFDGFKPIEHDCDDFGTELIIFSVNKHENKRFTTFTSSVHAYLGFIFHEPCSTT